MSDSPVLFLRMKPPDSCIRPGVPGPGGARVTDDVLADPARLRATRRLAADADDITGLGRLTRLAATLVGAPLAQVSLLTGEQVVLGAYGRPGTDDDHGAPLDDSLCSTTARSGSPLVVGDAAHDPRVATLPPVTSGGVGAYLGVPLRAAGGAVIGAMCVYDVQARPWSPEQVGVLGELAESVVAQLELRALSVEASNTAARLDLALDAADIGSFDYDAGSGVLHWDDRLLRLFGYDRTTFLPRIDSLHARVHPGDRARAAAAIAEALAAQGELAVEYRIVRPGGEVRWIEARGRVVPARDGAPSTRLLGVAYDSTELRDARDRLSRTLETMSDAFYALDHAWRFTYVNLQAERLLQRRREDLLGRCIWEEFPETGGSLRERYEKAVVGGEPVLFDAPYEALGGWYELNACPGADGLSVYFKEITERRAVEQQRERAYADREQAVVERERAYAEAEAANARLAILADASTRLSASLEPCQVLERLGDLIVPRLGQWVVVALTAETNALLQGQDAPVDPALVCVVHVAHPHPQQRARLAAVVGALALTTADKIGMGAVVRTGVAEWLPTVPAEAFALARDPLTLAMLREIDPGSVLTVPLISRDRVLGAITVAAPVGGPVDRALLTDLAGRAAVALDNALLYGAERRNGITLQHSLLPRDLPAVPGLLTAARYLPGTTGASVGGDWYQGVRVGDGLVLAIGDVMGHGMRSAARMGQLRAITATLALEGHRPGKLLGRLADGVGVLLDLDLATMLVAAYDPAAGTLTVASAGHPPPLYVPPTGPPRYVDVESGPPLGTFAWTYDEVTVDLNPGDTVVLYTDGLVENRGESLDVGLERLRVALEGVRLPPERVCDQVLESLGRGLGGDDDVALLVLSHLPGPAA